MILLQAGHLSESRGFVQGVAWNPRHPLLATLSSDRALRVYSTASKKLTAKVHKANLAVSSLRPAPPRRKKAPSAQPETAEAESAPAVEEEPPVENRHVKIPVNHLPRKKNSYKAHTQVPVGVY
jgi:hypothetical protein